MTTATAARPRFALAKSEADALLKEANITKAPVDVLAIAELCGAVVQPYSFGAEEMSGVLIREPGEKAIIGVNPGHPVVRQRFTIAHECGHLRLHATRYHFDRQMYWRDSKASTAESVAEVEANQFASNLLMPQRFLERDLEKMDYIDIHDSAVELAKRYGVSIPAMTLRLSKFIKYGL